MLFLACAQILSGYIYNTVCIDIEGNLDLRYTTHCRRNTIQTELSKGLVVLCELSLALQNVDINGCLVISCSREDLALLSRNGCISLNQSGCDTTHCLNGQGQRSYIQQQDITCACIACQLTALDGSTQCNALVRV